MEIQAYKMRIFKMCGVCTECRAAHGAQYTHHSLKHMLSQHCNPYNDVFYWFILQKTNCSKAQRKLPKDGPDGPKHVGTNIEIF
jgi:hypothetical protein